MVKSIPFQVLLDHLEDKTSIELGAKTLKRFQDISRSTDQDKANMYEILDAFLTLPPH